MTNDAAGQGLTHQQAPRWRRAALQTGKLLLVAAAAWLAIAALRKVDWAQVGDALARLLWWEIAVIAVIVAVRQTVNASTLVILLPGLGLIHA